MDEFLLDAHVYLYTKWAKVFGHQAVTKEKKTWCWRRLLSVFVGMCFCLSRETFVKCEVTVVGPETEPG